VVDLAEFTSIIVRISRQQGGAVLRDQLSRSGEMDVRAGSAREWQRADSRCSKDSGSLWLQPARLDVYLSQGHLESRAPQHYGHSRLTSHHLTWQSFPRPASVSESGTLSVHMRRPVKPPYGPNSGSTVGSDEQDARISAARSGRSPPLQVTNTVRTAGRKFSVDGR